MATMITSNGLTTSSTFGTPAKENPNRESTQGNTKDVFAIGDAVVRAVHHVADQPNERIPSRPLLGVLPVARLIPQDVHSVMDYANGATVAAGALLSDDPKARAASLVLGGSTAIASALTDYRLSVAKVIPIEAHEVIDYAFGVSAIAAPFVFGYYKTAPVVAATHCAVGAATILASLFTDYRAARGVGR